MDCTHLSMLPTALSRMTGGTGRSGVTSWKNATISTQCLTQIVVNTEEVKNREDARDVCLLRVSLSQTRVTTASFTLTTRARDRSAPRLTTPVCRQIQEMVGLLIRSGLSDV